MAIKQGLGLAMNLAEILVKVSDLLKRAYVRTIVPERNSLVMGSLLILEVLPRFGDDRFLV